MGRVRLLDHAVLSNPVTLEQLAHRHRDGIPLGVWLTGAPLKWLQGFDGRGRVIGVIDSGVDYRHPDLTLAADKRAKVVAVRDYVRDGATPGQYHYHGTHVAGTAAANGGLKGVAPGAQIADYRVLNRFGSGRDSDVAQAIRDALKDGCHVLNLSLGSDEYVPEVHAAVIEAAAKIPVVVAVGNDPNVISYPGYHPEVIGVGAVGLDPNTGKVVYQWFSTRHDQVDVSAPGIDVLSTVPNGLYMLAMGTSMATPHVSGVVAIEGQEIAECTGQEPSENVLWLGTKGLLTRDVDAPGLDARTGAGFVSFHAAIPQLRRVAVTTGDAIRVIDGKPDTANPMPLAPLMIPVSLTESKTAVAPREIHEAMHGHVGWKPLPNGADGKPRGTATFSLLRIPGMEVGQPLPSDIIDDYDTTTGPRV